MIVTRVIGDCPECGGKNCFGNVSVHDHYVLRGCMSCNHSKSIWLPEISKKIVYLDQFFFSHAFRAKEPRFIEAAQRIHCISELQLIVAPFSSIHEDETHQWRGYDGQNKEELYEFIKATSRGHKFEPAYRVEQTQIIRAFRAFLIGNSPEFTLKECDVLQGNIHEWDDYFRIDVDWYFGDIEKMRRLKRQSIEELVDLFQDWRQSTNAFDQDVAIEIRGAWKSYIESYFQYASRVADGDYAALWDSPIMSMVIASMLICLPKEAKPEERLKQVISFFTSEFFTKIPYQWLSAAIFATLKDMVKNGAYTNREKALQNLSGFFNDVQHVATYAPYCDVFVMDQPMAALMTNRRVGIEDKYGVKIFSLNNWDELFSWLDSLEKGMSNEHKVGLLAAYPQ